MHTTPMGFAFVEASNATALRSPARVRIGPVLGPRTFDWPFEGDTGTLLGFSVPHGWAIVRLDRESDAPPTTCAHETLVHPERLEAIQ